MLAMKFVLMQSFNLKKDISAIVISITKLNTKHNTSCEKLWKGLKTIFYSILSIFNVLKIS